MTNVLICGLGAIGSIYADKFGNNAKILVDKERLEEYNKNSTFYNGKKMQLYYVLPNESNYKADLIIIATKFNALNSVIENIENFVTKDTIIISLINGISSEKILRKKYNNVLTSFYIGHSAIRKNREIVHDEVNKIIFGPKNTKLQKIFDAANINYEISNDIEHAMWAKFMFNNSVNQISAVYNANFGDLIENHLNLINKLMNEVELIAKAEKINSAENLKNEALEMLYSMNKDDKTSMLQDIMAKRKTEFDILAGEIINLGFKHNIPTPYNKFIKEQIETIEAAFD